MEITNYFLLLISYLMSKKKKEEGEAVSENKLIMVNHFKLLRTLNEQRLSTYIT